MLALLASAHSLCHRLVLLCTARRPLCASVRLSDCLQVVFHYFLDRVAQADVERVASLTPLIHATLRSLSAAAAAQTATPQPSDVHSLVGAFTARLAVQLRLTAVEWCTRRPALLEPLFALLVDAAGSPLGRLTPHTGELVRSAWQQCRAAMSEQQLQQHAHSVEQALQHSSLATLANANTVGQPSNSISEDL